MSESSQAKPRSSPKRELLLDTAFRLFYAHGYHAVGIDTILAEAGVAKMTLYNHFKSKDELIVAALERRSSEISDDKLKALAKVSSEPLSQIEALFDWMDVWFRMPDFNGCAFLKAIAEYTDDDSPINQTVKKHKAASIASLIDLCQELDVPDPKNLAQQIFLLLEGSIIQAHTFGNADAAKLGKNAATTLIQAAKASPS
ncbi:TetR/AcrR family transcriptional regulator [Puniceicoccaceae bacterium K14]|nr:TetR/AcrR family transcriptional regulator [Puniceicoccaceae bacterium K14]